MNCVQSTVPCFDTSANTLLSWMIFTDFTGIWMVTSTSRPWLVERKTWQEIMDFVDSGMTTQHPPILNDVESALTNVDYAPHSKSSAYSVGSDPTENARLWNNKGSFRAGQKSMRSHSCRSRSSKLLQQSSMGTLKTDLISNRDRDNLLQALGTTHVSVNLPFYAAPRYPWVHAIIMQLPWGLYVPLLLDLSINRSFL